DDPRLPYHALRRRDASFGCLVGEHRTRNDVSDGPDTRNVGAVVAIHLNDAALVQGQAQLGCPQAVRVGSASRRHQYPVAFQRLGLTLLVIADHDAVSMALRAQDADAQLDLEALLAKRALSLLRQLFVRSGKKLGQILEDRDLRPQSAPDRAQL